MDHIVEKENHHPNANSHQSHGALLSCSPRNSHHTIDNTLLPPDFEVCGPVSTTLSHLLNLSLPDRIEGNNRTTTIVGRTRPTMAYIQFK